MAETAEARSVSSKPAGPWADLATLFPNEWQQAELGAVLESITNGLTAPQTFDGIGLPVTRIQTIAAESIDASRVGYVDKLDAAVVSRYRLRAGDILFSHINSEPQIGRAVVYDGAPEVLLHGMNLLRLRVRPNLIDPYYLVQFLAFLRRRGVFIQLAARAVGQSSINQGKLKALPMPVPPIEEQRAIASVLRSIQRSRDAAGKVIAATRDLKRSLMRYLFTFGPIPIAEAEKIGLQVTEIGPMPQGWELCRLGQIATVERGKFAHRPRNDPAFYGGEVPFIQTGDVTASAGRNGHVKSYSQTLNDRGLGVSRLFPRGTIAITIAANIGYSAILDLDAAFPDSIIAITPRDSGISNDYLNYYLTTQQPEMDRLASRGTQKNINIQFLAPWPVKVPPVAEQQRIVSILRAVDRKLAAEEVRQNELGRLFESLLADLMTGRRRLAPEGVA